LFPPADRQWKWIHQQALSSNEFERVGALATAAGTLEVAFTAVGLDFSQRGQAGPAAQDAEWPAANQLEAALVARHRGVHNLTIPTPDQCMTHIGVLYQAWRALRRQFVTKANAAQIAAEFLARRDISDVMLFGSLARGYPNPADIDLLILDNGELSSPWSEYGTLEVASLLEAACLSTKRNRAAERLRWLDLVIVNGDLFGTNPAYTGTVLRRQRDPFFFLNLADGVLAYNRSTGLWVNSARQIFERLAALRTQLEEVGLVRPQLHLPKT
jgi:predicted nucleotidyltransferase